MNYLEFFKQYEFLPWTLSPESESNSNISGTEILRNLHSEFAFLRVEDQVEATRSCFRQLTQHDVLRHSYDPIVR